MVRTNLVRNSIFSEGLNNFSLVKIFSFIYNYRGLMTHLPIDLNESCSESSLSDFLEKDDFYSKQFFRNFIPKNFFTPRKNEFIEINENDEN